MIPTGAVIKCRRKKAIKGGKSSNEQQQNYKKHCIVWSLSKVENVSVGPAITRYELKPAERRVK